MDSMKIGDFLLVTGFIVSLLAPVSTQAEVKQQVKGVVVSAPKSTSKTKLTRAQYNARYKAKQKAQQKVKKTQSKLDRQRAAWRAKWEAEQRAKKKVARVKKAPQKKQLAKNTKFTPAQLRWLKTKNARLKQQKAANNRKIAKQQQKNKMVLPKRSHAVYQSHNTPAIFNHLPVDIVSKLKTKGMGAYGVSAYVRDVNSPRPLLAYQDDTARVPASVMKLITSYASLGILGPNYRWPLDVLTRGTVRNGTLQGDLYIKGYGSPEFNTEALRKVLRGIRQKGIRNVSGRVVFDNTYFNSASKYQGSFDSKSQVAYNAKPDALLFNQRLNSFQVRTSGKRVHVSTKTPTHNLKIVNKMRKTRRGCRPRISVSKRGGLTQVTFRGNYSSRCGTRTYTRVISEPSNMVYGSMRSMWKREVGGTLNTRFAMGRVPSNARPLLRTYSRTLAQILPTIDKKSNNVMARQLLLTIGAKTSRGQGTERNGAEAVGAWLNSRGLHFPELRIENGSGLSRTARISARHVGDLLVDAYRSPYRNILMQALAIAGVDGTMKRRLRGTRVRGKGYFKTGTLRDVRSIAGYVKASDGKTYVMAILHNDPKARHRALAAHDKLIEWVFDGGRRQRLAMR